MQEHKNCSASKSENNNRSCKFKGTKTAPSEFDEKMVDESNDAPNYLPVTRVQAQKPENQLPSRTVSKERHNDKVNTQIPCNKAQHPKPYAVDDQLFVQMPFGLVPLVYAADPKDFIDTKNVQQQEIQIPGRTDILNNISKRQLYSQPFETSTKVSPTPVARVTLPDIQVIPPRNSTRPSVDPNKAPNKGRKKSYRNNNNYLTPNTDATPRFDSKKNISRTKVDKKPQTAVENYSKNNNEFTRPGSDFNIVLKTTGKLDELTEQPRLSSKVIAAKTNSFREKMLIHNFIAQTDEILKAERKDYEQELLRELETSNVDKDYLLRVQEAMRLVKNDKNIKRPSAFLREAKILNKSNNTRSKSYTPLKGPAAKSINKKGHKRDKTPHLNSRRDKSDNKSPLNNNTKKKGGTRGSKGYSNLNEPIKSDKLLDTRNRNNYADIHLNSTNDKAKFINLMSMNLDKKIS